MFCHKKIHTLRSTAFSCDEEAVRFFFGDTLGLFLLKESDDGHDRILLYEYGHTRIEIVCQPKGTALPKQKIILSANNSGMIRKKLEKHGIPVSAYPLQARAFPADAC